MNENTARVNTGNAESYFSIMWKALLSAIVFVCARMIAGSIFPFSEGFGGLSEEYAIQVFLGTFASGYTYALICGYVYRNSSLSFARLAVRLTFVMYLVNCFMNAIEVVYFRKAFPVITDSDIMFLFLMGLITVLLFVPLSLIIFRKGRIQEFRNKDFVFEKRWWKYVLASLLYVVFYFIFGSIAQLAPALRQEYAEWMADITLAMYLPLFQISRGGLFVLAVVILVSMINERRKAMITVALFLSLFISMELSTPTTIMSPALRLVHFIEINVSMILYGGVAVSMITRKRKIQDVQA